MDSPRSLELRAVLGNTVSSGSIASAPGGDYSAAAEGDNSPAPPGQAPRAAGRQPCPCWPTWLLAVLLVGAAGLALTAEELEGPPPVSRTAGYKTFSDATPFVAALRKVSQANCTAS